jgi:hypothetical protein
MTGITTVAKRYTDAFAGRSFTVASEFHLPEGKVAHTMFGHAVRHGYIIRDTENGDRFVVGAAVLKLLAGHFKAVTVPARVRLIPSPRE